MAFESTITEYDMDPAAQKFVQDLRGENTGAEPDLDVDGMSPSILSRILGLFSSSKH